MKLETIYLLHHSHTDIGFTLDQPVLWEMQRRFIDTAIDAAERHADHAGDHAFKWVVETVAPLLYWLDRSTDRQIERFRALERAGRIEVSGAFLNVTPLADTGDHVEMFQSLARLRKDYGFTITHMMVVSNTRRASFGQAGTRAWRDALRRVRLRNAATTERGPPNCMFYGQSSNSRARRRSSGESLVQAARSCGSAKGRSRLN